MTTTARPAEGQPRGRTSQVLLTAGLCVAGAVAVVTLVAALAGDRADTLGALTGSSMALCFFLFGSLVVDLTTRLAPQTAILVALMTYSLQVALVALFFLLLTSSGAVGTTLSAGWLAAGVVAATLVWTAALLVTSARARVPAYDIDLPGPARTTDGPSSGPAAGSTPGGESRARQVGAA